MIQTPVFKLEKQIKLVWQLQHFRIFIKFTVNKNRMNVFTMCLCVCVSPFKQHEEYILLSAQVFNSGCPCADLTPQNIIKDLCHVFLALNTNNMQNSYWKAQVIIIHACISTNWNLRNKVDMSKCLHLVLWQFAIDIC